MFTWLLVGVYLVRSLKMCRIPMGCIVINRNMKFETIEIINIISLQILRKNVVYSMFEINSKTISVYKYPVVSNCYIITIGFSKKQLFIRIKL